MCSTVVNEVILFRVYFSKFSILTIYLTEGFKCADVCLSHSVPFLNLMITQGFDHGWNFVLSFLLMKEALVNIPKFIFPKSNNFLKKSSGSSVKNVDL
jgi:hypothetical protein